MKLAIGMATCNRLSFTKKVVESFYSFHKDIKVPWIISDDGSTDGTVEWLMKWNHATHLSLSFTRLGNHCTFKRIFDFADQVCDIVLVIPNDWYFTRTIDFDSVIKLFKEKPGLGQVQTTIYKGKAGRKERKRHWTNILTGEPIRLGEPVKYGTETFRKSNFVWNDTFAFHRTRICRPYDGSAYVGCVVNELVGAKNYEKTGYDIYLMNNQPMWNLDYDGTRQTKDKL